MKITPQYSYLPYNLGLVYQRTNKRKEAEQSYRLAMSLAPDSGEPLNALGSLKAQEGKNADAEKLYRDALAKNSNLLAARHNLALLLAARSGGQPEAITLWRDNLQRNPDYLPSRLSLAGTLAAQGDTAGAIAEYQAVVKSKPEYAAARTALADLYVKNNDRAGAIEQLRETAKSIRRVRLSMKRSATCSPRAVTRRRPRPPGNRRSTTPTTKPRGNGSRPRSPALTRERASDPSQVLGCAGFNAHATT